MTSNDEGELKFSRTDWKRYALGLIGQILVTVVLTVVANYFVLAQTVAELKSKLENQRELTDVQLRALSHQYDELMRDVRELRAPLQGLKLGRNAQEFLDVSPYATPLQKRRKSLRVTSIQRLPLWHCITMLQGPSQGGGVVARGPVDCVFCARPDFF